MQRPNAYFLPVEIHQYITKLQFKTVLTELMKQTSYVRHCCTNWEHNEYQRFGVWKRYNMWGYGCTCIWCIEAIRTIIENLSVINAL